MDKTTNRIGLIMRNGLLLLFSIVLVLGFAEVALRYIFLPWINIDVSVTPMVFLDRGYYVNPSSGSSRDQLGKTVVHYQYYPPHLRDTAVNPQATHILVLGDSFTFGWLLPWQDTYIHHLQMAMDKEFGKDQYQFLNAAVGGWGTADYLSYLEDYGSQTSPQYVLVFLNTDDIGRSIASDIYQFSDSTSLQLTEHRHPMIHHPRIREILSNSWLFAHSSLLQLLRYEMYALASKDVPENHKYHFQSNDYVIPESSNRKFENAFAVRYGQALFYRLNQWCQIHHAKLLVVTTGFNAFYPAGIHDPTKAFLATANSFFHKENIPYDDIASSFKKVVAGKNFQIPTDLHPNPFGAKMIAEQTWPWIKQQIKPSEAHHE